MESIIKQAAKEKIRLERQIASHPVSSYASGANVNFVHCCEVTRHIYQVSLLVFNACPVCFSLCGELDSH
jgi:hypothetical protein